MSTNHQTGPKGGPVRIAVDVMGGDHAPDAILKGCVAALDDLCPGDTLVLVGRGHVIRESLEERGIDWHTEKRIEIVDAAQVVEMADSAKQVRVKTDSSITKMHQLGSRKAEKRCDVVLSAGNTAACVMAATLYMGRLDNVIRPGIAVTVPAFHGPLILIDAGANPDPKPEHLWQYGIMADVMARTC
jgi:phosphate acyltransferase